MLARLNQYQITDDGSEADVIIVNTCGFIQSAKEESIDTILELHDNKKDGAILVASGCLTERYKDELQNSIPEIDIMIGVGDYDKILTAIEEKHNLFSKKVFLIKEEDRVISNSNYHAYIKLSEGCDQKCSFCAIPTFKGTLQSRPISMIVNEVKKLASEGYIDFSFIAQDSSSYLRDEDDNEGLIKLIKALDKEAISNPNIKSARILYLYPTTTSHKLIDTIRDSKLFHNYFDIPLQHINTRVLKSMKRGLAGDKLVELMQYIKSVPNSFIRTSFIVGFPDESQAEFEELCQYVEEFGFDRTNVFGYSDEEDTFSYNMSQKVSQETIDKRAQILGDIVSKSYQESLEKLLNQQIQLIIEGQSEEHEYLLSAKALNWAPEIDGEIYVNDTQLEDELEVGKIYDAVITEIVGDKPIARVVGVV
jgi:ribosomal protein S12 methylthiotransferase RimO